MPEQKMKITDEQFTDFTGTMFNTPFTKSVSDTPMTEYRQNRLAACFKSEPHKDAAAIIHVQSVTVAPKTATVLVGETVQLGGSIKPDNATDRSYNWVTDNAGIATVDASGLVKGIAEGNVKIRLVANDGSVFGEAAITVNNPETVQV
ncbi:Ig-like domain-containing protein [Raoultella ornithinolytica]|uniref:Ig-like domain-containing protein n=1 Tax=Raoultella ornithinolytica TaxID=54291 RepID=UPI000E593DDB|nr:Ig-like domain-containing protein [Raoultella ornithinolytica]